MFKNDFQGGPYFEILSAQGKDAASYWKTTGGVKKTKNLFSSKEQVEISFVVVYDKEVKSYVFTLEGSPTTTKMQIPKDSKIGMTLVQRFLVLQIFVPKGQDVTIEIGVSDLGNNKRRLVFSTAVKDISVTPLHGKLPLTVLKRAVWLNLAIDMVSMVAEGWKGNTFRSIDSLSVSANCKIRKVFTMKVQPSDTTDDDVLYDVISNSGEVDAIPRQCQMSHDVQQSNQVLTMTKLKHVEYRLKGGEPPSRATSANEIDLNSSGRRSNNESFHIAFGSKVAAPPPATASRKLTSGREGSRTSRSSHSRSKLMEDGAASGHYPPDTLVVEHSTSYATRRQRLPSDPGSIVEDPETSVDKASLTGSHTWNSPIDRNDETPFKKPHPPREPSTDRARRKIRVKSGSKERTPHTSESSDKQGVSPMASPRKEGFFSPRQGIGTDAVFNSTEITSSPEAKRSLPAEGSAHTNGNASLESAGQDEAADESISDIINAVRSKMNLNDPRSKVTEYVDSDEELQDRHDESDELYIFKSKPTVAPRRVHSPVPGDKDSKGLRKSQVGKSQHLSSKSDLRLSRPSRGAKPDSDFIHNDDSSDDETGDMRKKLLRNTPSPRPPGTPRSGSSPIPRPPGTPRSATSSPSSSAGSHGLRRLRYKHDSGDVKTSETARTSYESSVNLKDSGVGPSLSVKNHVPVIKSSDSEPSLSRQNSAKPRSSKDSVKSSDDPQPQPLTHRTLASLRSSGHERDPLASSMNSTASRMSISKKSLREIPKTDARLSQQLKPYDATKYQMADLSESFEANMLLSLKRQQENDEDDDGSHNNTGNQDDSGNHGNSNLAQHEFGDDAMSSSSDDTSYSTWRGPAPALLSHHYQDEMHLPASSLSNDPLNTSNPRDWTGVFSPPIVLPSDMAHTHDLNAHPLELKSPRKHSPDSRPRGRQPSQGDQAKDTDSEDELDLLYDPCLNCYFDPKTCKYYELV